jgi:hypothetical protein
MVRMMICKPQLGTIKRSTLIGFHVKSSLIDIQKKKLTKRIADSIPRILQNLVQFFHFFASSRALALDSGVVLIRAMTTIVETKKTKPIIFIHPSGYTQFLVGFASSFQPVETKKANVNLLSQASRIVFARRPDYRRPRHDRASLARPARSRMRAR